MSLGEPLLQNRNVLVTGCGSGIGAETCRRLAISGARVGGLDFDARATELVMRECEELGATVAYASADVRDAEAVARAVDAIATALGGLDSVVNSAGIGAYSGDVVMTSLDAWEAVIATDLTGSFHVCRAAIPHLRRADYGAIVLISSQYGIVGCANDPAYCAAKAGVIGLTRALAIDHAPEGIRVNCICPGPVDTPMLNDDLNSSLGKGAESLRESLLLLGRYGAPSEVAGSVVFLLSEDAGFITGTILTVDGGWTAI